MKPIYDNPLPVGWREKKLRDIAARHRGYSWEKGQETSVPEGGSTPVIRIPNIQDALSLTDLLYLRNVPAGALATSGVMKDWILFVGSNGNPERIGDSVLISEDRPMVFASFLQGISTKDPTEILPEFLAQWMRLHSVHQTFSKTSQQTTGLANFSWSAVKRLPLRYPAGIEEQRKIVVALSDVQDTINAAQQQLLAAEHMKAALMQQLFTRGIPGRHNRYKPITVFRRRTDIPKIWEASHLGDNVTRVEYGTNEPSNDYRAGYPVIAIPQVIATRLELGQVPYTDLKEKEANALRLVDGDVLLIRTNGNPNYMGKSTLVTKDVAAKHVVFASYLIRIRTNQTRLLGAYLNYFLASPLGRQQALAMANTSAGNHNLGARSLKRFWLPRPDTKEQEEIVEILDRCEDTLDAISKKIESLGRFRKSLLQNLLTGKVRVNTEAQL